MDPHKIKTSMKKTILFLAISMGFIRVFSQIHNHSAFVPSEYGMDIPFQIASYDVIDTVLPGFYGISQTFSTIIMENENYAVIDSLGFPLLPRYVFDLWVPLNSSNYSVTIILPQIDSFYVSSPLLPAIDDIRKDSAVYSFNMDTLHYGSNDCFAHIGASIFEEYRVFGEKGVAVSVIPFEYCPVNGLVRVLTAGKIRVFYTLDSSLISRDTMTHRATKAVEEHLGNFFCNYEKRQAEGTSENYLIITPPQFENSISYFADYKQKTGYNVTVVNTNTTGRSASSIISYLKSRYNNISTRPEYVLLVGSPTLIPVSAGTSTDIDDPVEDNNFMENLFEKGHNYVVDNSFQPKGFLCTKLYQPNLEQVQGNLSNNPLYFIYSGHGNKSTWAGISFSLIADSILTSHNKVYPFPFAFACYTGDFTDNNCIANKWVLSYKKGSTTYFGSSVSTCCHSDYIIEKKIFESDFSEDKSISSIINSGMNKYRLYFWAVFNRNRTKRYLKAYNLLGDPSLIVGGKDCLNNLYFQNNQYYYSGEFTEYHVASTISNDQNFVINSGASIHLTAGEEIILITTPYTLDISALPAGIYAVRVLTTSGNVATGKVVKFG